MNVKVEYYSLCEAYSKGFALAALDDKNKMYTPIATCKDYITDMIYAARNPDWKGDTIYAFKVKKHGKELEELLKRTRSRKQKLYLNNRVSCSSTITSIQKQYPEGARQLRKVLGNLDKALGLTNKTTVRKLDDGGYILSFSKKYYTELPYYIFGIYMNLARNAFAFDLKNDTMESFFRKLGQSAPRGSQDTTYFRDKHFLLLMDTMNGIIYTQEKSINTKFVSAIHSTLGMSTFANSPEYMEQRTELVKDGKIPEKYEEKVTNLKKATIN